MNNFTDLCECYPGWENEKNMNLDDFIPSTIPLQMCTVRKKFSKNIIKSLTSGMIPRNWTFVELVSFIIFKLLFIELNICVIKRRHILYFVLLLNRSIQF